MCSSSSPFSSSTTPYSMADQAGYTSFSSLHSDIIQTHILTKLDGQTLAAAGCASQQLHDLCTEEKLWTKICTSTWPSTDDPRVQNAISEFPSGHGSFFSDSFPTPNYTHHRRRWQDATPTSVLISAVDLHYQDEPVFSKVHIMDTNTDWFRTSPFRVDLLDLKETAPTLVKFESYDETCRSNLEKHLTLSWIVIDPTRKRSVNLSSTRPVSVTRNWLTGDVQVRYATVMPGDQVGGSSSEYVNCSIEVTCGGKGGGELHMSMVSLQVQDMDGKSLSGEDSLVIIQGVMESERRKNGEISGEEMRFKGMYEEYMEMKRERKEKKERRERRLDMVCIASGVSIFIAFWGFILF